MRERPPVERKEGNARSGRRLRLQVSPGNARFAYPLATFAVATRNYCNNCAIPSNFDTDLRR